ncbi:MAG: ABC transporter permease [Candidatus Aminicenantes bacterium]|nr:ABC transporter permease [Candidatus Aminicenantes bacterium]
MTENKPENTRRKYRFLRLFFRDAEFQEKIEDLEDLIAERSAAGGKKSGGLWMWVQVSRLALSRLHLAMYWSLSMARNYFVIARRNLLRHKAYSLITVFSLSLGLAGFLLISVWAGGELGYDRFHENSSRIYRVEERRSFADHVEPDARTPGLLSEALKDGFPEVRKSARVAWTGERVIRRGEDLRYEEDILCVDPDFLSLFSFPLLQGDRTTVLDRPDAIVVSESFARRYFGDMDPIGETLTMDGKLSFSVAGILEDVPANSHLRFDALVPFDVVKELGWMTDSWDFSMALTYIELERNADFRAFENKIAGFVKTRDADSNIELVLQPLTRIWLYSNLDILQGPGRIRYVVIFAMVGFLILLIACVNYMNLATARSEHRAREIGLRKVVGAAKSHLVRQFLLEAVFTACLAFVLIPPLIAAVLPSFNKIAGTALVPADFLNPRVLLLAAATVVVTGLLSGSYPALFLSSMGPGRALKSPASSARKGSLLRKTLVVAQISTSVVLLIASAVIFLQMDFLKSKDLGFDKERVLSIPLGISNRENAGIYQRYKDILAKNPRIARVGASFTHPTQFGTPALDPVFFESRRLDEEASLSITSVETGFIETLGIRLLEGRIFAGEAERGNLIINESFQKLLGVERAVGRTIRLGEKFQGTVIGVVGNFHMSSPSAGPIGPLLMFQNPNVNFIFVRLGAGDLPALLRDIEKAWKEAAPQVPFKFSFIDEDFNKLYSDLDTLSSLIRIFTIVAALIAGFGLFALASFAVERRTKEIGIRKVLGSTAGGIWLMLSREFLRIVLGACLIACPVAWIFMRGWLMEFSYRVNLSWGIFVLGVGAAAAAAMAVVSLHTVKASRANPVDSIRNE